MVKHRHVHPTDEAGGHQMQHHPPLRHRHLQQEIRHSHQHLPLGIDEDPVKLAGRFLLTGGYSSMVEH